MQTGVTARRQKHWSRDGRSSPYFVAAPLLLARVTTPLADFYSTSRLLCALWAVLWPDLPSVLQGSSNLASLTAAATSFAPAQPNRDLSLPRPALSCPVLSCPVCPALFSPWAGRGENTAFVSLLHPFRDPLAIPLPLLFNPRLAWLGDVISSALAYFSHMYLTLGQAEDSS
ncbi:hypothetical protein F4780DRAFT_739578 [Xylariomycetidae sp. FL0641]|nr:hypothetical protein F4780DRAFT_739578 [Xylariomycetidae sp. FL0641]